MTGIFVPETRLSIGIFGGTFDPVHIGHITLAEEIKKHLQINRMYLLPCRLPPHRNKPKTSEQDRLQMLRLATADTSLLIDERELKREGSSYTFDTLQSLRTEYGTTTSIICCMGMDTFALFNTWHRWQEVLSLTHLVVVTRPGYTTTLHPDLQRLLAQHPCVQRDELHSASAGKIYLTQLSQIPVSSTQVRQQLAQGILPPDTLHPTVHHYIQERGLYLTQ